MARRTQTTRATNQDRTSASAESSIAQAPASQVVVVVEVAMSCAFGGIMMDMPREDLDRPRSIVKGLFDG
jgi:hypothetical protein